MGQSSGKHHVNGLKPDDGSAASRHRFVCYETSNFFTTLVYNGNVQLAHTRQPQHCRPAVL